MNALPRSLDLDWNDLRHFLAVAHAGSLSAAARALGVKHSTVGRRLRALERALGAALVLRHPEGVRLTPVGERVFEAARPMEQAAERVGEAAARSRSWVRLAAPSGFADLFASVIVELRASRPEVVLQWVSGSQPLDLGAGEAALALRVGEVKDPELVVRPLCGVGWSLYAARGYLAQREVKAVSFTLEGHLVLGFDRALAGTAAARWIEERVPAENIVLRARETVDLVQAAAKGVGVGLLPCYLAERVPDLVRLSPDVLVSAQLSLVYRREARESAAMKKVMAAVVREVSAARSLLEGQRSP